MPIYIIAGTNTLDEMGRYFPQSLGDERISGFGDAKIEKYGQQFLDIILEYCKENNLSSLIHEKIPKKEGRPKVEKKRKRSTLKENRFDFIKKENVLKKLLRKKPDTRNNEGHLAHYVSVGEINIDELVSKEKILLIEPHTKEFKGGSITTIKEKLGCKISFGEIRLVLAGLCLKKIHYPATICSVFYWYDKS